MMPITITMGLPQNLSDRGIAVRSQPLARFQAEWIPFGRPEIAPALKLRTHSDAKPVSTFAECALRRRTAP